MPELILTPGLKSLEGHPKGLDFNRNWHLLAAGGQDKRVCIWGIDDYTTTLSSSGRGPQADITPKLKPACVFKGHEGEVSDVEFHPNNSTSVASVGHDKMFIYWDIRSGAKPSKIIRDVHDGNINTLDWCSYSEHYILTGGDDGAVKLIDVRKWEIVQTFKSHQKAVRRVKWKPIRNRYEKAGNSKGNEPEYAGPHVFLSASEDSTVKIWNANNEERPIFTHYGHGDYPVLEADWLESSPDLWTIASLGGMNTDMRGPTGKGGGNCQIWRPNQLFTMGRSEALETLRAGAAALAAT